MQTTTAQAAFESVQQTSTKQGHGHTDDASGMCLYQHRCCREENGSRLQRTLPPHDPSLCAFSWNAAFNIIKDSYIILHVLLFFLRALSHLSQASNFLVCCVIMHWRGGAKLKFDNNKISLTTPSGVARFYIREKIEIQILK
ncbi:hypothetical protein EVAR_58179_1 [Eumeta japonica]|uniref:Uncharacterized protein n=1 Tax=Eumeta variegata TaxID=151549 RepID=A0A4C1YUQ2_EUMVA|nr:hypothetical protein EVAR_58179_1 [Eumeta japonica]